MHPEYHCKHYVTFLGVGAMPQKAFLSAEFEIYWCHSSTHFTVFINTPFTSVPNFIPCFSPNIGVSQTTSSSA